MIPASSDIRRLAQRVGGWKGVVLSKTVASRDRAEPSRNRPDHPLVTDQHSRLLRPDETSPHQLRGDVCVDVRPCALADRRGHWLPYAPLMLVFTREIGQSVQASDATVVGRLRDLTARLGAEHPTVHRLAIGSRRHMTHLVPWSAVAAFERSGCRRQLKTDHRAATEN